MSLSIGHATQIAREILNKNPNYVLSGSLALVLAGDLKRETVGDLDFACLRAFVDEKDSRFEDEDYNTVVDEEEGYSCFKVQRNGYYWNLFARKSMSAEKITVLRGEIPIQDRQEIIKYKKKFGREKDLEDLSTMQEEDLL